MNRKGVFISYSKKDTKWLDYLRVHLNFLERQYQFTIWDDSKIQVGDDWRVEINKAINSTKIAILMVSANFLSSEFINNEELPALLTAAKDDGAHIFPIIISHCMFSDIEAISKFQTINNPSQPLISLNDGDRDALFMKVTQEIKRILSFNNKETFISEHASMIKELRLSFHRVSIMNIFYKYHNTQGLSIKEIHRLSKLDKRKEVIYVLHELEAMKLLGKTKIDLLSYYKLTAEGCRFVEEFTVS